jgi:penicillin-binding protein 1A
MMNAMLQETLVSGTARKAELPGWPAAGKTGTSQDFRDAWFVGYTGHLIAGVWLGNDDSSPMKKTTGGGLPVDIWSRFMRTAHQGVPVAALPGTGGGFMTAGFAPPARVQPVTASAAEGQVRPVSEGGIDTWLIDRLFGRRQ